MSTPTYNSESLSNLLPLYYKYIFPYNLFCKWLNYSESFESNSLFAHREFSFTLQNDIYVRYQSFNDESELKNEIQRVNPCKIDIGAIYNYPPKDHNKLDHRFLKTESKELVFDIDMSDYDDVRNCCKEADICGKCWDLMKIAIKILHETMVEDFGFNYILWVYSGRRGIHCWVCDEKARNLSTSARSAIIEYLNLFTGRSAEKNIILRPPINPYIQRCLKIINQYWKKHALENQNILGTNARIKQVLNLISSNKVCNELEKIYSNKDCSSSEARWQKLKEVCSIVCKSDPKQPKIKYATSEIMLQYCFPRLDINVSKGINHLLKSPFCVHPKTGRVCVPIKVEKIDEFDPFSVPTVNDLCLQLERVETEKSYEQFYNQTSLKLYIQYFEEFLKCF